MLVDGFNSDMQIKIIYSNFFFSLNLLFYRPEKEDVMGTDSNTLILHCPLNELILIHVQQNKLIERGSVSPGPWFTGPRPRICVDSKITHIWSHLSRLKTGGG